MKTIKFKNDWRYSRQGDVIEEGDGVAQLLIARGIAEEVQPEEARSEEETVEENQVEQVAAEDAPEDAGTEQIQDSAESALPQIITRQVPGPTVGSPRRGGRG